MSNATTVSSAALLVVSAILGCHRADFAGGGALRYGKERQGGADVAGPAHGANPPSPVPGAVVEDQAPGATVTDTAQGQDAPATSADQAESLQDDASDREASSTSTSESTSQPVPPSDAPGGSVTYVDPALPPAQANPEAHVACGPSYAVPATANLFLAGVAQSVTLTYSTKPQDGPDPVDRLPAAAPVLAASTDCPCIQAGSVLAFHVTGSITYASGQSSADADGFVGQIVSHQKGGIFGKSDIVAPMSSLLGVFLSDREPTVTPPRADFSTPATRDYALLRPAIGQIFYIGNGRRAAGELRKVEVPPGATRLYFGVMDTYQWNNNLGTLHGSILVQKR